MLTPVGPKNILESESDLEQHGERSHVKMHRGMQRATTFYFGGAKLTFFIDSFLIFLFAHFLDLCFN